MSLTTALIAAGTGLRTAQTGIDLVSRNVANATTPGYTRKTAQQTPLIVGGQGQGVRLELVQRTVNARLQFETREALSATETYRVTDDFLSRFELAFGKPGDGSSIASQLGRLGDAFRQLATNPDVVTAQATVVSRAEGFARGLNDLTSQIQGLRTEAESGIRASVDTINSRLATIDRLNVQIVQAKALGQSTADLEDRRDIMMDDLSREIDITYFTREGGDVWIMTRSGQALLDTRVHSVTFANVAQVGATQSYPGTLDGLMIDGTDVTAGLTGGRIKGLFDLRDTLLPQAQTQVDELASKVTTLFAAENLELFMDGGATFTVAGTTGYAGRIVVNPAVKSELWRTRDGTLAASESANRGDATIPLAIINQFEAIQTFPAAAGLGTTFTIQGYAAAFISFQGSQRADIADRLANQSALTEAMQTRLTNDSGVNVDRELALMIELQSSYSAAARMIQAIKEMYDQLLRAV